MFYKDNTGETHNVKREYEDIVETLDDFITLTATKHFGLHQDLVNVWDAWVSSGALGD